MIGSRFAARPALVTALILLLPLLAMQITDEVVWNLADFVVAGGLIFGTGLTFELVVRKEGNIAYRLAAGIAFGTAFLLVWLIGAVGVIGAEGDRADLMYFGVLAVGIVGVVIGRFRPDGMARALIATALAQALVALVALVAGKHQSAVSSVFEILGLNGFFVALFIGSAWLFRHAADEGPPGAADPITERR